MNKLLNHYFGCNCRIQIIIFYSEKPIQQRNLQNKNRQVVFVPSNLQNDDNYIYNYIIMFLTLLLLHDVRIEHRMAQTKKQVCVNMYQSINQYIIIC